MTTAAERLVSKGELARIVNASPSAISKYFERGILGPDVVVGEGQRAKIRLEPALRQIQRRRDPSQALGNGFKVQLAAPAEPPAGADLLTFPPGAANPVRDPAGEEGPSDDQIGEKLRLLKLREAERKDRIAEQEELASRGVYVRAAEVQSKLARVAGEIITAIEAQLPEMAQELAQDLKVPARDLQHALRQALNRARTRAAASVRRAGGELPETLPDEAAGADPCAAGV